MPSHILAANLTSPSERSSEHLRTHRVETAAVAELRLGAPVVAGERVNGCSLPFREITRVDNEFINSGDERDQDGARKIGGQGAARITRG